MAELPSGAITFLFTDIEGSTRLLKQLRERYAEVLGQHHRLLRAAFAAHCHVLLVFHVDEGDVEGTDVGGLTIALLADAPGKMIDGSWRVGVFMDDQASQEQAEALGAVFSGQKGGPMEAISGLIGEMLGMETVPIEYVNDGTRHHAKIGDDVEIEIEDVVPEQLGEVTRITNVAHPASTTLTVAQATISRIKGFGLDISNVGKNGHSAPFSWAA